MDLSKHDPPRTAYLVSNILGVSSVTSAHSMFRQDCLSDLDDSWCSGAHHSSFGLVSGVVVFVELCLIDSFLARQNPDSPSTCSHSACPVDFFSMLY